MVKLVNVLFVCNKLHWCYYFLSSNKKVSGFFLTQTTLSCPSLIKFKRHWIIDFRLDFYFDSLCVCDQQKQSKYFLKYGHFLFLISVSVPNTMCNCSFCCQFNFFLNKLVIPIFCCFHFFSSVAVFFINDTINMEHYK